MRYIRKTVPTLKSHMAAFRIDRFTALLLAIGMLGAALILLRQINYGPGVGADSILYISAAWNLAEGNGFVNYWGEPYIDARPALSMGDGILRAAWTGCSRCRRIHQRRRIRHNRLHDRVMAAQPNPISSSGRMGGVRLYPIYSIGSYRIWCTNGRSVRPLHGSITLRFGPGSWILATGRCCSWQPSAPP